MYGPHVHNDAAASMAPIVLNLRLFVIVMETGYFHSMNDFQPVVSRQCYTLPLPMCVSPQ